MTPVNFNYVKELDEETLKALGEEIPSKYFRRSFQLPVTSISPNGMDALEVTHARKGKWHENKNVLRIYVRSINGEICITIPYQDQVIYQRYRALLNHLKFGRVYVTFPNIRINHSTYILYFMAKDFKIVESHNINNNSKN